LLNAILAVVDISYWATTIVGFVLVLGITVTVHEFGHFLMAKLLKIRVVIFSLGFGPRLVGFTRGGTEYRLSPIPLGGYVKMAGETFDEERKGDPDEFLSHPKWHRFLVAIAGPFMNILLAVAILTVSYTQGVDVPRYPKEPAVVGPVAAGSIAQRAGLETGDRVISIHGNRVTTWEEMEIALETAPKDALDVEVARSDRVLQLHFDAPETEQVESASLGFKFPLPKTIVYLVEENSPAQKAGLRGGDEILAAAGNEKKASGYNQILNLISESKGIPLNFTVLRPDAKPQGEQIWDQSFTPKGRILHLHITPIEDKGHVKVGFSPDYPSDLQKFGIFSAIGQSVRQNYEMMTMTFQVIGRIFKGSASVRTIAGPIEIARISGSAARSWQESGSARLFFAILGLISLNLGIFNILPIPILDGGVIALLVVEGVIRRDFSLALKEKIVQVGFVFLILLMGFVVFNDLSKIIDFDRLFK
jgi:regulator of sigma E protease